MDAVLTNDAKDAQNIWSKYHQHVDESEQNERDGDVTQPIERLGGEQHLLDGSAHLWKENRFKMEIISQHDTHGWNKSITNSQGTARSVRSE